MGAVRRELREEGVAVARLGQRPAAKIDRSVRLTGQEDVSGAIDRDAAHGVERQVLQAEALAPEVVALRGQLHDERGAAAVGGGRAAAEIDRAAAPDAVVPDTEIADYNHVPLRVDRDSIGHVRLIPREGRAP